MNKKYLLYAIVPMTALAICGGVVLADTENDKINPMADIVDAIAQKFNLNASDVQAVFDEQKIKMETQREQNRTQAETDKLSEAVANGKLTQIQADLIIAKRAELYAQNSFNINKEDRSQTTKTKEEVKAEINARQEEMKAKQETLKQWATDNNIPIEYIQFGFGMQGKGNMPRHNGPIIK